jgi:hypothetical protein
MRETEIPAIANGQKGKTLLVDERGIRKEKRGTGVFFSPSASPFEEQRSAGHRCSRRATRMIIRPLTKMESCSMVQAVTVSLARG